MLSIEYIDIVNIQKIIGLTRLTKKKKFLQHLIGTLELDITSTYVIMVIINYN